jgi:hypothetical protein
MLDPQPCDQLDVRGEGLGGDVKHHKIIYHFMSGESVRRMKKKSLLLSHILPAASEHLSRRREELCPVPSPCFETRVV